MMYILIPALKAIDQKLFQATDHSVIHFQPYHAPAPSFFQQKLKVAYEVFGFFINRKVAVSGDTKDPARSDFKIRK